MKETLLPHVHVRLYDQCEPAICVIRKMRDCTLFMYDLSKHIYAFYCHVQLIRTNNVKKLNRNMLTLGLAYMAFMILRYVLGISSFSSVMNMKGHRILSNVFFCFYSENHMILDFKSTDKMNYIY